MDDESFPKEPNNVSKKISRRDFLKLVGVGGPAAVAESYLALKHIQRSLYETLSLGLSNPSINDELVTKALKISEMSPNSENPNFRPMTDLLEQGVNNFEHKTGKKAFYERSDNFRGNDYYKEIIKEMGSFRETAKLPSAAVDRIVSSLPEGAFEAYFQGNLVNHSFQEMVVKGSGFETRFRSRHPELVHSSGLYLDSDEASSRMEMDCKEEMEILRLKIEQESKHLSTPLSASFVFEHFLEKNEGNIAESVYDTTLALKFFARNNPESGDYSPNEERVEWFKKYIKDEYQGPSYIDSPENEREINLIGKPYHSWNLVALLQFVPNELIRLGAIQKQVLTFDSQGLGKTRADLQTLTDLRDIENLLLSYSRNKNNP